MTPEYRQQRQYIQTGDVVLFSGKGAFSEIIKRFTFSNWSHVGVAVKLAEFGDTLCLLESTTLSTLEDIQSGEFLRGVQIVRLSDRVATYKGSIAYRAVYSAKQSPTEIHEKTSQFYHQYHGTPYEEDQLELIQSALDGPFGLAGNEKDLSTIFCSELVAQLWQDLGWLATATPSNEFTPHNFAGEGSDRVENYLLGSIAISEIRYLRVSE